MNLDRFVHRYEPPESDGAPTLLLLHGTGADETDLLPLAQLLAPDAAVLAPRGRVSEHGMPRWFARRAEGVFDLDDLAVRTDELADWVLAAAPALGADPGRLVAIGFSNGANVAVSLLLRRPEVLRAAVLFAPMLPYDPPEGADLGTVGAFLSAGRHDPICPPEQVERLAVELTDRGAAVEVAWHDGGHTIDRAHVTRARQWLDHWRGATASSLGRLP